MAAFLPPELPSHSLAQLLAFAGRHMDSRSGAGPLLPVMRIDVIDYTHFQFARIFEADVAAERGLGVDVNHAEIDDSSLPGPGSKPDVRFVRHVLALGCHPNCPGQRSTTPAIGRT